MYQSNRSFNIPPRAFELLKIGLFKFPPPSQMPHQLVLTYLSSKTNFVFSQTSVHVFQRELCRNETFRLLLKTLLKELFANKGKILSCKFVKPCKNRKNSRAYYTLEQEINLVQIPHPSKAMFKFPPLRARCTVKCPGYAPGGGGDDEASI